MNTKNTADEHDQEPIRVRSLAGPEQIERKHEQYAKACILRKLKEDTDPDNTRGWRLTGHYTEVNVLRGEEKRQEGGWTVAAIADDDTVMVMKDPDGFKCYPMDDLRNIFGNSTITCFPESPTGPLLTEAGLRAELFPKMTPDNLVADLNQRLKEASGTDEES